MYNKTIILSEYDRRDRMRFIHKMRVIILFSTFFLCKHQNFGCVIVYICFFFLGDITSRNANRCLNYRLNKMQNKYEYYHSEF